MTADQTSPSIWNTLTASNNMRLYALVLAILVLTAVLTNQTYNTSLRADTAEDVVGDVEDIGSEAFDALALVQDYAQAVAAELAEDPDAFPEVVTNPGDEEAVPYLSQIGYYATDGEVSLLDYTDPAAPDEAAMSTASVDSVGDLPQQVASNADEPFWAAGTTGAEYVVPLEADDSSAFIWAEIPTTTLNDLLAEGAAGEELFASSNTAYALLLTADNQVIAQFQQADASQAQIEELAASLNAGNLHEEGYYEIEQDALIGAPSFVAAAESELNDWRVIGSFPASEVPTAGIVESTFQLFDVSEAGNTVSLIVEEIVDFLNEDVGWLFRGLRWPIEQAITAIENVLLAVPWFLVILATAVVAAFIGGRRVAIIAAGGMFMIGLLGLWELTMTTMAMLLTSMAFCVVVGIPVGIWAARNDRVNEIVRSILDAMQTIHPFVYLVPIVVLFGIGKVPGTIATIIFALPPMVRLTNLGIRQVPEDVVEAGKAFGSSDWQLLRDVQIPLALPSIMAGVNQTLMLSLSMVVIVALIAGGGLGQEIYRAIGRADTGRAVVAGVAVLLLAVVVDRISQGRSSPRRIED